MADAPPSHHEDSSHDAGSPWAQRGFLFAAAFIAVIALTGLGLLIAGNDDSDGNGTTEKGAAPGPTTVAKDSDASVCGLRPGSQTVPSIPPEAKWELVGTIAAPSADALGPGIKDGKRRLCFAHSPTGAVFAAVNFIAVAGSANTNDQLMRELTASTAERDELLAQNDVESGADPAFRMQVAGFRVVAASDDEATVELAFAGSGSGQQGFISMALPMRWERGDWKVVIASTTEPYAAQRLDSASGYVPWSGA